MPASRPSLANIIAQAGVDMQVPPRHRGVLLLACQYAAEIDRAEGPMRMLVLKELGPKLLDALAALGMTPVAAAKLVTGAGGEPTRDQSGAATRDDLRNRRASRAERAGLA